MKKIPTLFEREFDNHHVTKVLPIVTKGMEWVLNGEGIATVKFDGACCAIINGEFYKRYDAKHGKLVPNGAIKCQEVADPVTGHLPCWVKCDMSNPADRWFWAAYYYTKKHRPLTDGTYEAVGMHFQGNPYCVNWDYLVQHGKAIMEVERTFDGIREWLKQNNDKEGIVFWKDGIPQCKIKRTDFGFEWNGRC